MERKNGWFETSFMPGRSFVSPADFNDQFTDWLVTANQKVVRTTKARPVDLLEADRAGMLALPPVRKRLAEWGVTPCNRDSMYPPIDESVRLLLRVIKQETKSHA